MIDPMRYDDEGAPEAAVCGLPGAVAVEIVVPVFNEEAVLAESLSRLCAYLRSEFPLSWQVTIADNASTDRTLEIAQRIAGADSAVRVVHLDEKGRGRALRRAWLASEAAVACYMDVDLSTDLRALLPLVAPLLSGHSDLAIGTRLARRSAVVRGPKRELISRSYNCLLRLVLGSSFSDAQCGFKAIRTDVAAVLVPLVEDEGWFFDTELLLLAERNGLRIAEVPVDWVDDPDSRVDVTATARADLAGMARMARSLLAGGGQIDRGAIEPSLPADAGRFARVGVASTLCWLLMLLGLRPVIGLLGANALALSICAVGNLAAHRHLATARRDRLDYWRDLETVAAGSWLVAVGLTTLALLVAGALHAPLGVAVVAAFLVGGLVSAGRFVTLRALVMGRTPSRLAAPPSSSRR